MNEKFRSLFEEFDLNNDDCFSILTNKDGHIIYNNLVHELGEEINKNLRKK